MLLKFVMPNPGRGVGGTSIVKWHKAVGDRVQSGDDLVDVRIEEKTMITRPPGLRQLIEQLTDPGFATCVARMMDPNLERPGGSAYTTVKIGNRPAPVFRVQSSDAGVLRKITAPEGTYCTIGQLLALVTTKDNEALQDSDTALAQAIVFRAVPVRLRSLSQG
jgi:hypothetical protein